ncbi:unnamed protein product [Urochloa humidicola]
MASAAAPGGVVVVFDFDRTIIDWDSDNWVITKLGAADAFQRLRPTMPWNRLMDRMMAELHARGKTVEDIRDCLRSAPLDAHVISAIKTAAALGCDLKVVSDANTFFIDTVLDHHGVLGCFSEINTNPAQVDADGRLRISPFHDAASAPHGCSLCPENMCKGKIIEKIQAIAGAKISSTLVMGREITAPPLNWVKKTMSCQRRTTLCGTSSATTRSYSRLKFIHGITARNWKRLY